MFLSVLSRHMLSSRMVQPALSSPVRTRPSSTCSLKAITRSVSLPPLVTRPEPRRMRFPLPPATLRAGGRISAGMISTVQTPLPIRAAIAARDCPQRCAPSPESLTISTICSLNVTAVFPVGADLLVRGRGLTGGFGNHFVHLATLGNANARVVALPQVYSEECPDAGFAGHRRRRNHGFSDNFSCCARPSGRRPSLRSRSRRR